jgi:alkanesulfonate monooxygenase
VLIGGTGPRRTPRLAARFADEYNVAFHSVDDTAAAFGRVVRACSAAGRDPSSMTYSCAQVVCCGRSPGELEARAAAIGKDLGELRADGLAGTPAEVAAAIGRYAEIGAQRMYLQVLDLQDTDHLRLIAAEVLPRVSEVAA